MTASTNFDHGKEIAYGGFWIRVVAAVVDSLVLLIPSLLITLVIYLSMPTADELTSTAMDFFASLLLALAYNAGLESSAWQATVGKRVVGLKVTDYDGNRISFIHATGRYFAKFLSALTLLIGFMMVGWTKRKQGLHDLVAGTLVVKTEEF